MSNVRKAVIAAAGFGTRFLPQTKAMPKEMLPLVDKPIIQQIVEEVVAVGVTDIVIVTGYHKRTIEDHFDHASMDLQANLEQSGKLDLLEDIRHISDLANFAYIRQKGPYGTGTPLLNAAHLIGDEPFFHGLRRFYRTSRFQKVGTEEFRVAMQQDHMQTIWREFGDSVRAIVPLFEAEIRGVPMLQPAPLRPVTSCPG